MDAHTTSVEGDTNIKQNADMCKNNPNLDLQDNDSQENSDPIVIHPDSDSENDLEFSDAIEANDKSAIKDELTDIKNKNVSYNNRMTKTEEDLEHLSEDDDFFKDAEDHETLPEEQDETDPSELKREAIKRREEAENRLSNEVIEERRHDAIGMKKSANELYVKSNYKDAIDLYTKALDHCPLSFKEDRAIFLSNRAIAKLKLEDKNGAVEDCTEAIDLNSNYLKAILRRAQIYEDTDRPHESLKDFERVLELDPKHIESIVAVRRLPEKIKEKDEKIKAEMMDNLKKLGNMCLKPFGLSTNNFKFEQDPNTGGYSVNFKQ